VIVDSHCHVSSHWYEPAETLLFQMDRCGVDRAVLVQLLGAYDNGDMLAARAAHPDRFAVVAAVRPDEADPARLLGRLQAEGISALRLRPGTRSPGTDELAVWRAAEMLGFTVSCVGTAADFTQPNFAALAEAVPGLPIVLEHLGGLARPDVEDRGHTLPAVLGLAHRPNLFLKLPGLGQLAPRRAELEERGDCPLDLEGVPALLDAVLGAFGAGRLMWGSDFPPVASREGYAHALAWPRDLLRSHGEEAGRLIFGGTASGLFWKAH
jgi:L-fuconolactonase